MNAEDDEPVWPSSFNSFRRINVQALQSACHDVLSGRTYRLTDITGSRRHPMFALNLGKLKKYLDQQGRPNLKQRFLAAYFKALIKR